MDIDFYKEGSVEEILAYFSSFGFLTLQLDSLEDYVIENSKNR